MIAFHKPMKATQPSHQTRNGERMNSKGLPFLEGMVYLLIGLGCSWILARWQGLEFTSKIIAQTTVLSRLSSSSSPSSSSSSIFIPRPQFIFTIALLSGDASLHATLGKSIEQTTAMQTLNTIGVTPLLVDLHKSLYQSLSAGGVKNYSSSSTGLWNAHCEVKETKANAAMLHADVVHALQQITKRIQEAYTSAAAAAASTQDQDDILSRLHNESILPIPINTVLWKLDANTTAIENRFGHATYPTEFLAEPCHRNDFPSLDLLYAACQDAKVDCRHVYVHRPPIWELKQIMTGRLNAFKRTHKPKRDSAGKLVYSSFGNHLAVLHLWNTMLHVMADEMIRFAPRGLGCINSQNYQQVWKEIWGGAILPDTVFPVVKDIARSELNTVLPISTAPYVESYLQLFRAANLACQDSYQQLQDYYLSKQQQQQQHGTDMECMRQSSTSASSKVSNLGHGEIW